MNGSSDPLPSKVTFWSDSRFTYREYASLDSTNSFALQNADIAKVDTIIRAVQQRQGRGRFERTWIMEPGKDVSCSFVLDRQAIDPARLPLISFVAALAVYDVLRYFADSSASIAIKWPNDVLINDKKIAGILTESDAQRVIIGIGINLQTPPSKLRLLTLRATSLDQHAENGIAPESVTRILAEKIRYYYSYLALHSIATIIGFIQPKLAWIGQRRKVSIASDKPGWFTLLGINARGHLVLRDEQGIEHECASAEILYE